MKNYILSDYQTTDFEKKLELIENYESISMLPLIHKVDGLSVRDTVNCADDVFKSGMIEPVMCDVFNKELIYTFVGRPAFNETMFPVCFVIEPAEELLENIFVFDTGAYASERYEMLLEHSYDINQFRIPANVDYVKRHMYLFFETAIKYYINTNINIKELLKIEEDFDGALFDYIVLNSVRKFKNLNFDTRCRTIENILKNPIDLKKYLKAIIVPSEIVRTKKYKDFIKSLGRPIDVIKYHTFDINAGSESNITIKKLLYRYYLEKELL